MSATTTPERIAPRSVRYRLDAETLAAALQLLAVEPDGRLLPPTSSRLVDEPAETLRSASLLADDGRLPPFLAATLTVAARPARTVHVVATVPGSEDWADVTIGAAADGGPYVSVGRNEGGVELYALETAMEVAAVFDDMFHLMAYPARPVDPDVIMAFPAWVGLLAVADVHRLRRLRNDLRRRPDRPEPITVTDIEGAITVGTASDDSRWAVSSALPVAPIPLRDQPPGAADVVRALVDLGALAGGERHTLTPLGEHLVELVSSSVLLGSVTLTHRRPDREVRGGEMLVYRTPTRLAIGIWSGTTGQPVMTLTEPTPEAAVAMMKRLVELPSLETAEAADTVAPAPPPFDPTHVVGADGVDAATEPAGSRLASLPAGTEVRVLARDDDWAEVVVESGQRGWVPASGLTAPDAPSASPTHRVGEGGTSGWEQPDPAAPATVRLHAGALVTVVEESGVWARILTEEGWEGWVDGRHLLAV